MFTYPQNPNPWDGVGWIGGMKGQGGGGNPSALFVRFKSSLIALVNFFWFKTFVVKFK